MQIGARTVNAIATISVSTGGLSYSAPPSVVISGGGGTGASAVALMSGTMVNAVHISNAGTGYTTAPTISFVSTSAQATISSFTAATTSGTLTFSSPVATTWAKITAGSSTANVSSFANATQAVVATTSFPTGEATLLSTGTGAAATAYVGGATLRPMTFFRGRNGDTYGVDGMGRGIRWDGTAATVQPIGVARPAFAPAVTAVTTGISRFVAGIQLVNSGGGYNAVPTVTITGGTPTTPAKAEAYLVSGRVAQIKVVDGGSGYQETPTVVISGGIASGAAFTLNVRGAVRGLTLTADGSGYTTDVAITGQTDVIYAENHGLTNGSAVTINSVSGSAVTAVATNVRYYAWTASNTSLYLGTTPSPAGSPVSFASITAGRMTIPPPYIQFSTAQGLTGAVARLSVTPEGQVSTPDLRSAGTGASTSGVTATVVGGGGSGAAVSVAMQYSVHSVSVATSGSGYFAAPIITIRASTSDPVGFGAAVTSVINTKGNVTGATVAAAGAYLEPPTAIILDTSASATATLASPQGGTYLCAIRYIDSTPESAGGPIPSSISDLVELESPSENGSITWTFSHAGVDDRVAAMELWRTSSNQGVLLYRVATIPRADFANTYSDTLSEAELTNPDRDGYGLMPITLPSGQVNARRFEVPPAEFAVAVMFQDRAWYAVDATGVRNNTLMFSEIDEPESVPPENEFVLQENSGESDKIVGLVPLGSALLIAQQSHLYRLTYVAQPVLDAAIVLASNRGMLNSRCWGVMGGVAFLADSNGIYAFDGQNEEPLSIPVDNYWRDRIIDFSKSHLFHVRCDQLSRVMRFYYCTAPDTSPTRALCYCAATKTWWEETYPSGVTASCSSFIGGAYVPITGTAGGAFTRFSGTSDAGTGIPYNYRTGAMALNQEPSRSVSFLYKPTITASDLNMGLHYNNSPTPRPNAVASDRGSGFVAAGTFATLNMSKDRSALAEANGFARAYFSGRVDDRSAGGDRHMAVAFSGTQSADSVSLYGVAIDGVTS